MHALTLVAHILGQAADPVLTVDWPALLASFLALAGWAAFAAALINIGKLLKWLPDGAAPNASLVLNVVGFAVLVIVRVFRPDFDIASADAVLATVASILTGVLALLSQFGVSKLVNNGLRGVPLIGYSHSLKAANPTLYKFVRPD